MVDKKTINFINKIFSNTLRIDFEYHINPYTSIIKSDRQFRTGLCNSHELYKNLILYITSLEKNIFYFIEDNFSLRYIVFYPFDDSDDIITIGPYLSDHLNSTFFQKLSLENNFSNSDIEKIKGFYYSLPKFDNNLILTSTIYDVLSYINPESPQFNIKEISAKERNSSNNTTSLKNDFYKFVEVIQNRYNTEQQLLTNIADGNYKEAIIEANKFLSAPMAPRMQGWNRDQKTNLFSANTLFRKAVEVNNIHPVYLDNISSKYAYLIENTSTETDLNTLYEKMIKDYCFLVRNKSMKNYSKITCILLNYIDFNLDKQITLGSLAELTERSIPYISNLFKREVKLTIIDYLNKKRIQEALRLLNSTDLQIQEISVKIGMYDPNYFTKVFKKEIGCTPVEYRKKINSIN